MEKKRQKQVDKEGMKNVRKKEDGWQRRKANDNKSKDQDKRQNKTKPNILIFQEKSIYC